MGFISKAMVNAWNEFDGLESKNSESTKEKDTVIDAYSKANERLYDRIENLSDALKKIKEIVETDLKVKVIQNGGNCLMIYYADYSNKIQKPILDLIKESGI